MNPSCFHRITKLLITARVWLAKEQRVNKPSPVFLKQGWAGGVQMSAGHGWVGAVGTRAQLLHTPNSAPALPSQMLQKVTTKTTLKGASQNTIYRLFICFSTTVFFTLNFYVVSQFRTDTCQHSIENRNIRFQLENFSKLFSIPHKIKKKN